MVRFDDVIMDSQYLVPDPAEEKASHDQQQSSQDVLLNADTPLSLSLLGWGLIRPLSTARGHAGPHGDDHTCVGHDHDWYGQEELHHHN